MNLQPPKQDIYIYVCVCVCVCVCVDFIRDKLLMFKL